MFFLLYRHTDDGVFHDLPKISDHFLTKSKHFLKISQDNLRFPKIAEDCLRLSRKTPRCFDDTPTNLSTIEETNLISVKSPISSLVRIWKIRHSSPGCGFV